MAEQKNAENIVFLPWTVESQPQTQAVILQQPSETHLRLDATTDKTAISSFALSVVIALILGGLATWLAYWYGRKSFDLTKQSFDAVMAQIKSSEQVALDLNQKLFEQQRILQNNELNFKKRMSWESDLRNLGSQFIAEVGQYLFYVKPLQQFKSQDEKKYKELVDILNEALVVLGLIDLHLAEDNGDEIMFLGNLILTISKESLLEKNFGETINWAKMDDKYNSSLAYLSKIVGAEKYAKIKEEKTIVFIGHLLDEFTRSLKKVLNKAT